jgi:sodium/potassium-transporting ATPase subunit alpha
VEGDNKLPEKDRISSLIRFLKEITNWFAIMLWIGSVLCIITYIIQPQGNMPNLVLGFVLIAVIILNGYITFAQGEKS